LRTLFQSAAATFRSFVHANGGKGQSNAQKYKFGSCSVYGMKMISEAERFYKTVTPSAG
jgi:hypothetical protein